MQAVITRWHGFLDKIKTRFEQVMAESKQGCAALLEHTDLDPTAMTNAWNAMEIRCKQLEMKVSDTFNDSVESAFDDVDAPADVVDAERDRGLALARWMELERERVRIEIMSAAAQKIWQRAVEDQGTTFNCSQCAAGVAVPNAFRAVNVTCGHCGAVNTYEPGARVRAIEWFCVHPLSERAAWHEWVSWQQAEDAYHAERNPKIEHIQAVERTQIDYWKRYLEAQAGMLPEKQGQLDADLRGKMRQWYEVIDREKAWIQAGRPRTLPFS